jgi:hypothetical protein
MPAGTRFDWHTHEDHQLAWAASGVLTVLAAEATWVLPSTRALWIPAGLPHETASEGGRATMRSLYIRPGLFAVSWSETGRPTPVAASPLLAELIGYLGGPGLDASRRAHAEALLADLLTPVPVTTIGVRLPSAVTARRVAEALRADPADGRAGQPGGRLGRLRHPERVRGRVPPRDGPDPGFVLQTVSPVYRAANASVSPDSSAIRLTARAPCPTWASARSSTG